MGRFVKKGAIDQSAVVRIIDSTDGTPELAVTAATGGLVLEYRRELEASVSLAPITDLGALTTAHTDKGIKHIGNGYYRVDVPDAAFASGANNVLVHGVATGMVVVDNEYALVDYDPQDAVRLGLTALPNAAAEAAGGGLYTRGSGAGQIAQDANGRIDVSLRAILGTALTETSGGLIAAAFKKFFDKASPTGTINSIPDAVPAGAGGLETVDGSNRIAGMQGTIPTLDALDTAQDVQHATTHGRLPAGLVGGKIDANVGSVTAGAVTASAFAAGAIDAAALHTTAVDEIVDGVLDEAIPEPTAVFAWPGSLRGIVGFLGALARNKITQTASSFALRNDADNSNIATASVTDDSTTFTRNKLT